MEKFIQDEALENSLYEWNRCNSKNAFLRSSEWYSFFIYSKESREITKQLGVECFLYLNESNGSPCRYNLIEFTTTGNQINYINFMARSFLNNQH